MSATGVKLWKKDGRSALPTDEALKDIGQRVRKAREAHGWSLVLVAEKLGGVDPGSISDAERGVRGMGMGFLLQMADILGVPPASLMPGGAEATVRDNYDKGYKHGYLAAIRRLQDDIPS